MIRKDKEKNIKTEFLPSALEIIETPSSPIGKITIWLIGILIMSSITWMIISKVDEVAVARGKIIPDGKIKVIQSLESGIVTKIYVNEGDEVKKDQILMELDMEISKNELEMKKTELSTAKLEREFLKLLMDGSSEEIEKVLKESEISLDLEILEHQLKYKEIKEKDFNEKNIIHDLNYKKAEKEKEMAQKDLLKMKDKIENLEEEYESTKELYEKGAIAKKKYKDKKNELKLAKQEYEIGETKIEYYKNQMTLDKNQKSSFKINNSKEILNELIKKDKEILELSKNVEQLKKKMEFQVIKSPVNGVVQGLGVNTLGGVVKSGNPLVSIIPKETDLIIEAKVTNKDIGFIHLDQNVDIKMDTFPFQRYGTIEGNIKYISPDAIKDERLGYVYKVKIKPNKYKLLVDEKEVKISTGMTVTAEIKTGKRRIVDFFLPGIEHLKDNFKLR